MKQGVVGQITERTIGFVSFIGLIACFIAQPAMASCGATNIVITNATPEICRLIKSELKHGYFDFVSSAPRFIPPNTTAMPIILSQSFYGSELELHYSCGDHAEAKLLNQHGYRMFFTGPLDAKIVEAKNLTVEVSSVQGSCLWNEHASIQWLLRY